MLLTWICKFPAFRAFSFSLSLLFSFSDVCRSSCVRWSSAPIYFQALAVKTLLRVVGLQTFWTWSSRLLIFISCCWYWNCFCSSVNLSLFWVWLSSCSSWVWRSSSCSLCRSLSSFSLFSAISFCLCSLISPFSLSNNSRLPWNWDLSFSNLRIFSWSDRKADSTAFVHQN